MTDPPALQRAARVCVRARLRVLGGVRVYAWRVSCELETTRKT